MAQKSRVVRTVIFIIVLVALVIGGVLFWRSHQTKQAANTASQQQRSRAVPVVLGAAQTRDVPVYFEGIGTVQASSTVIVHSRVDGQLIEVDFKEGQDVKKGDLLAKLDARTYQSQLDQAQATLAKDQATLQGARVDLQRYVALGNKVTGQQLDTQKTTVAQLEAGIKSDQAAIENARTMLSYCTITAPTDGRTGFRQVDPGNIVHAGDTNGLVTIAQLHPISVIFTLPQQNLVEINRQIAIQKQLAATATSSDGLTTLAQGTLTLIDNQINQSTGTITLKATFPNQQQLLWPGGFVNIRLLVRTEKNGTVIPDVAVQHGQNGAYVFAVDDQNRAHIHPVKINLVEGQQALVQDGLQPGDRLIVDGMSRLQENSLVTTAAEAAGQAATGQPSTAAAAPATGPRPPGGGPGQRGPGQRPRAQTGQNQAGQAGQGQAGQPGAAAQGGPGATTGADSGSSADAAGPPEHDLQAPPIPRQPRQGQGQAQQQSQGQGQGQGQGQQSSQSSQPAQQQAPSP